MTNEGEFFLDIMLVAISESLFSHRKQPLRGALESRLLILVHLFVVNEPYEHVISNSKDSEVAEASTSTVSIYPGQDCDIARQEY